MIRKAKALNGSLHFSLSGTNFNPFSKNLSGNSPCFIPSPTYHEGLNEFVINSREDLSNRDNAITLVKSPNNTKLGPFVILFSWALKFFWITSVHEAASQIFTGSGIKFRIGLESEVGDLRN